MNNSHYIHSLEDAEYQVVSSRPLADADPETSEGKLFAAISHLIDQVFSGRRGRVFTYGINAAGLSNDATDLQSYYDQNANVIDGYFERIDMARLGDAIGGKADDRIKQFSKEWFQRQLPTFAAGAAVGAVVLLLIKRK